jgi:hypothetical protein
VYQEQVMQIFRELAGYSLGRADLVRRAMAKKKHDVMNKEREYFIYGKTDDNGNVECVGALKKGVSEMLVYLEIEKRRKILAALEEEAASPEFWNNQAKAKENIANIVDTTPKHMVTEPVSIDEDILSEGDVTEDDDAWVDSILNG